MSEKSRRSPRQTKREKRIPREFFRPTLPNLEWEKAFMREPGAKECLERILSGVDEPRTPKCNVVIQDELRCTILQFMYGYWALGDVRAQQIARDLLTLIGSLPHVEMRARRLAELLGNLHGTDGLLISYPHRELAGNLLLYADQLKELRASWQRHKRKLRPRNISRSFELAKLVHHIDKLTGRPHYADLATLMSCALNAHGCPPNASSLDEDALRHFYSRFNSRNPGLLDAIAEAALR